ncbi:MAG TPA: hypothetical protein VK338_04545 [Candidatus Nitrosocosmicus sp.]|nr:hypothetical protein [Candidatus Nitrosocosmicus sp.]
MISLILFIVELIALFFIARFLTNEIYYFLRRFTNNNHLSFAIITIIYLPGTIIHELSHYFAALFLFLKVKDITVWPQFQGNHIKLGSVQYIKADFFRGFLVGVAPLIIGIIIFYLVFYFKLFPSTNFLLNILLSYLLFIISLTMFSSKQDMIDAVYILPLLFIIGLIIYIFQIDPRILFTNSKLNAILLDFIHNLQIYFLFVLGTSTVIFGLLKIINKYLKKR